jgi:hypothetical protein
VQFSRVVTSSLSPKTAATLYNVEGIGGLDRSSGTPVEDTAEGAGESKTGVELFGALGLIARPLAPTTVEGRSLHMEVVCLRTADGLVPIAARDVRLNQAFPNPKPGDVVLVGYGQNFVKLGVDGSISLATTLDGTPNGQLVQIQHRRDGFAYVAPWGKLTFDQGGLHVLHSSGARLDLGGIGGIPAPLDVLGSYAVLSAAMLRLEASAITVGSQLGFSDNGVKATPLEVLLALIGAALSAAASAATAASAAEFAEAAAFTALGAVPTNAPAAGACTTAAGLATTAAGLLTTAASAATTAAAAITASQAGLPAASPTTIRAQSLLVT